MPETTDRLVIASNNKGKIAELTQLLKPLGLTPVPQGELGVSEAEEPAITFVENAILKARHAARVTGLPALADDSGLAVDSLGGQPGVRSARYAGESASDDDNVRALLAAMKDVPDLTARARYDPAVAITAQTSITNISVLRLNLGQRLCPCGFCPCDFCPCD